MAFKRSVIFPNYYFEGQMTIPDGMGEKIRDSIQKSKNSGITTETVYGWFTNKQFPLEGVLPQIANLLGTYFVDNVLKTMELKSRDINKMIKSLEAKGSRISSKDKEKLSNLKFLRDYHMGRGKARKLGKGLAAVGVTALGLGAEIAGKRYLSRSLRRRGSLR